MAFESRIARFVTTTLRQRVMPIRSLPHRVFTTLLAVAALPIGVGAQATTFEVTYPRSIHAGPITGRLIVVVSKTAEPEPRLAMSPIGPAVFGVDVEGLTPGQTAVVDARAVGHPMALDELPPGDYHVQALLRVYERVSRADGHTLWLPMNDGLREPFNNMGGDLLSDVQRIRVGDGGVVRLAMSRVIPPRPMPAETEWVKHVRIQSGKLTRFWGRPIYIHARVLLPRDYDRHPQVRYPAIYTLGHSVPFNFSTDSTRVRGLGTINPVTGVETGYDFYRTWSSDGFPRVIAIAFEQQTPYFPDSYSVNSANNGPYGDAIVEEVIPALEERFRIIREPWARHVEGASTGGWQTLALQLQHPDFFGGAWVLQPDPIDFRRYILGDIYADTNAFTLPLGQFTTIERPFRRTVEGQVLWTMRQVSRFEAVLGSRGRSQYQLEAWEAVYGPAGPDGHPVPLWDKLTGTIDRNVAHHMRDNGYDLREYAERNWATLGPKLAGKLHFFTPDMDDFYLNLAMYRFEEFARTRASGEIAPFVYGRPMKGHSWHDWTWGEFVRLFADDVRAKAPPGADVRSWMY